MPILSKNDVAAMFHDNLPELTETIKNALFETLCVDTPPQLADILNQGTLDGFAFVRTPLDYKHHFSQYRAKADDRFAVNFGPVEPFGETGYSVTPLYGADGNALLLVHINYIEKAAEPVEFIFEPFQLA